MNSSYVQCTLCFTSRDKSNVLKCHPQVVTSHRVNMCLGVLWSGSPHVNLNCQCHVHFWNWHPESINMKIKMMLSKSFESIVSYAFLKLTYVKCPSWTMTHIVEMDKGLMAAEMNSFPSVVILCSFHSRNDATVFGHMEGWFSNADVRQFYRPRQSPQRRHLQMFCKLWWHGMEIFAGM